MRDFIGKRVHIIGLGAKGTGRACAEVLSGLGARVTISDEKTPDALTAELGSLHVPVRLQLGPGEAYADLAAADLLVPSPGVPLYTPAIKAAREAGVPVVSEIELAFQLSPAPIVAITGTKGKTTTTTLIGLLLNALGVTAHVGGNIGTPLISLAVTAQPTDWLVAEVSSFQLEAVDEFRPRIAVFTNLYPDHLDRYENDMALYLAAKLRLFARQTAEDIAIVNVDRPESADVRAATQARIIPVSTESAAPGGVYVDGDAIISEVNGGRVVLLRTGEIRLRGRHNWANVLEALAVAEALGLPTRDAVPVLTDFRGVPNRLEEVATVGAVTFYNDSQGTTPMAVRMALQAFADAGPVLIAGGRAKVSDFSELGRDIVQYARALVVIGEAADSIAAAVHAAAPDFPVHRAPTLPDAVAQAHALAQPRGVVLLSPACASFDMFRNMEHRGETFRAAVAGLVER